ncbi:hypothetical protein VQH23_16285 [Pararoseomonas sp. SCSIO 73927]|uniref:hypothetical protein n=1 Tax=Pararoseomonas sp. SCSIO 73927 TaxID=3114537 RepID=UPI0030CE1FC4
MRRIVVLAALALAACSPQPEAIRETCPAFGTGGLAEGDIRYGRDLITGAPGFVSRAATPTPAQARENSLLEDALSGRPDYVQALRRAAEANISEQNPTPRESRASR